MPLDRRPPSLHLDPILSRRAALRLAAGAGLAAAAWTAGPRLAGAASGAADLAGVTLRVATYKGLDHVLLAAAGLTEAPYRLEFAEFASGNLIAEAINAGAIDVGSMSEIPPIFSAVAGGDMKIVATIKDDVNWQVVLVPPGSPIASIADLEGKSVGYVRATTTQYYLAKMLATAGLGFSDITGVPLTPAEGQAAFDRGSLDAWAIYGYNVPFSIKNGARVLVTANGFLSGNYAYTARAGALDDPRLAAATADFLTRLRRAFAWREANLSAWAAIRAKAINVPTEIELEVQAKASDRRRLVPIDDAAVASEQAVADTFFELGLIPRRIDVAPLFDRRFAAVLAAPLT